MVLIICIELHSFISFILQLDNRQNIQPSLQPINTITLYIIALPKFELMKVNTKRENISLEETLAYIKFLNREKPFDKEEILIPTKDYEEINGNKHKIPTPRQKKKAFIDEMPDQDLAKKINKNRAIKRIIESAFQILQKFNTYEEPIGGGEGGDKSSEIQFNIYLKQYNRVLEMIHKREIQKINTEGSIAEQQQQILQNIYEYTVVEDFREILPTAILKDKISKTNLDIMIDKLNKCLVLLKPNELRLYDSVEQTESYKSIKLHEIQNVDYHTQPYIFIVLTIQKDKERFNIYMQFQSQKNQQKWDRALYCCFIGRKMKTKQKFFIIDYPEEDVKKKEKEEIKNQASFNYEIMEKKSPIDKIYNQKKKLTLSEISREDGRQNSDSRDKYSRSNTRNNMKKNSTISKQENSQMLKEQKMGSEAGIGGSRSHKFTNNDSQTNRYLQTQKQKRDELINRNKTDYINIQKEKSPIHVHTPHEKDYIERSNIKNLVFSPGIEEDESQPSIGNNIQDDNDEQEQQKDVMPDDIKNIHMIERKNVKGIVLQKVRFFLNKAKIIFLKESSSSVKSSRTHGISQDDRQIDIIGEYEAMKQRQLQYWDFNSSTGQKSERKVIRLQKIKEYSLNEEKQTLLINHDKEIIFSGNMEQLQQIYDWIDRIKKIFVQKLGIVPQNA